MDPFHIMSQPSQVMPQTPWYHVLQLELLFFATIVYRTVVHDTSGWLLVFLFCLFLMQGIYKNPEPDMRLVYLITVIALVAMWFI